MERIMSEIKHTPGPWTYSRWDEHGYTRFYIAQQEGAPYTPDYSDVASMVTETVSGERIAVQEANARLIAAAPELLEALRLCYDHCRLYFPEVEHNNVGEAVRSALAKATGA
jgi:hypothetical protein